MIIFSSIVWLRKQVHLLVRECQRYSHFVQEIKIMLGAILEGGVLEMMMMIVMTRVNDCEGEGGSDNKLYLHVSFKFVVVLPSNPLATDGPTLQHLGKQRPRPVRRHHHRPAALKRNATDGHISLWEAQLTAEGDKEDKPLEPVKLVFCSSNKLFVLL